VIKDLWRIMLCCGLALLWSPVRADVVGGIDFPPKLAGFELRSVTDNEKTNPGLGVTLLYNIPGVKASVYVYNHAQRNIPPGIDSLILRNEFVKASGDVLKFNTGARVLKSEDQMKIGAIPVLHSSFRIETQGQQDRQHLLSELYLTTHKGNFIKVRATYSETDRPELGEFIQRQFIEELCKLLEK
jgi:hypothetical protein